MAKGPPQDEYRLGSGGKLYSWTGGSKSYNMPSTTNVNVRPTYGGGLQGTATTYPGGDLTIGCTLQISADAAGIVRGITVMKDTIGAWNLSRCAEVLNN